MFNSVYRTLALTFALAVLAMAAFTASAGASPTDVIKACNAGGSLDGFSKSDLEGAKKIVPDDSDQYSSCGDLIEAALANKLLDDLPGGKNKDVKSQRAKLKLASVNDLTTKAERDKAKKQVANATELDDDSPLSESSDPAIRAAAGNTLASSAAPNTPVALIIGVLGLLLLLGADLASRLGLIDKLRSGSDQSDSD